jgi:hypothetical protein
VADIGTSFATHLDCKSGALGADPILSFFKSKVKINKLFWKREQRCRNLTALSSQLQKEAVKELVIGKMCFVPDKQI